MILDALVRFTVSTTATATATGNADGTDSPSTGTETSSQIIDLHSSTMIPVLSNLQGARDMGIGDDPALKLLVVVTVAFTVGTSLQINLTGATDNGSGAPNAFSVWWGTPVYTEATLVIGARLMDMDMPRPPDGVAVPRFLQLQYVTVGTHSTGKLMGAIVLDRIDQMYQSTQNAILGGYPAGITVAN
jgi:hypothetical protein